MHNQNLVYSVYPAARKEPIITYTPKLLQAGVPNSMILFTAEFLNVYPALLQIHRAITNILWHGDSNY